MSDPEKKLKVKRVGHYGRIVLPDHWAGKEVRLVYLSHSEIRIEAVSSSTNWEHNSPSTDTPMWEFLGDT